MTFFVKNVRPFDPIKGSRASKKAEYLLAWHSHLFDMHNDHFHSLIADQMH